MAELNQRYSNKIYTVFDYRNDDIILSVTYLNPQQETRGHSHDNFELYYFGGDGEIIIGNNIVKVKEGDFQMVPSNLFHKVINHSSKILTFVCSWKHEDRDTILRLLKYDFLEDGSTHQEYIE